MTSKESSIQPSEAAISALRGRESACRHHPNNFPFLLIESL
jgi:hypothetical protein